MMDKYRYLQEDYNLSSFFVFLFLFIWSLSKIVFKLFRTAGSLSPGQKNRSKIVSNKPIKIESNLSSTVMHLSTKIEKLIKEVKLDRTNQRNSLIDGPNSNAQIEEKLDFIIKNETDFKETLCEFGRWVEGLSKAFASIQDGMQKIESDFENMNQQIFPWTLYPPGSPPISPRLNLNQANLSSISPMENKFLPRDNEFELYNDNTNNTCNFQDNISSEVSSYDDHGAYMPDHGENDGKKTDESVTSRIYGLKNDVVNENPRIEHDDFKVVTPHSIGLNEVTQSNLTTYNNLSLPSERNNVPNLTHLFDSSVNENLCKNLEMFTRRSDDSPQHAYPFSNLVNPKLTSEWEGYTDFEQNHSISSYNVNEFTKQPRVSHTVPNTKVQNGSSPNSFQHNTMINSLKPPEHTPFPSQSQINENSYVSDAFANSTTQSPTPSSSLNPSLSHINVSKLKQFEDSASPPISSKTDYTNTYSATTLPNSQKRLTKNPYSSVTRLKPQAIEAPTNPFGTGSNRNITNNFTHNF